MVVKMSSFILISPSTSALSSATKKITATLNVPKLRKNGSSIPKLSTRNLTEDCQVKDKRFINPFLSSSEQKCSLMIEQNDKNYDVTRAKLYAILEAVKDRVEMHVNIGEQRNNWHTLLLNSINMIILSATTMAGLLAISGPHTMHVMALKLSVTLLFSGATGMLGVMNKLQPSQLVEEQRNAARLFKQLEAEIGTMLALRDIKDINVDNMMERVLALDRAYPLPLIGVMLEKFPSELKPAVWWPKSDHFPRHDAQRQGKNGWTKEMEEEMRQIVGVLKTKDQEDYIRLGNIALKINKVLAFSGPFLTGLAATCSLFEGYGAAVGAGALATIINALQHGGQIGMVFEMYRNCAGFFELLQEYIESPMQENEVGRRENGELVEMKVALQLGRSLPELREFAKKSASLQEEGKAIDEFASKLF